MTKALSYHDLLPSLLLEIFHGNKNYGNELAFNGNELLFNGNMFETFNFVGFFGCKKFP